MKRLFQFTLLLTICFVLYGCPYDSRIPIDHSRAYDIDNNLLGNWKNRSDGTIYTLSKYDAYTYRLAYTDSGGDRVYYYPFISFVGSKAFLCLPHKDEFNDDYYYLFNIYTSNNTNTLHVLGLNSPADGFFPHNSIELKSWIFNSMYSSNFYSTNPDDNYVLDRQ